MAAPGAAAPEELESAADDDDDDDALQENVDIQAEQRARSLASWP